MSMYILQDGTEVSAQAIVEACKKGMARLVHGHGVNRTINSLTLDGRDIDTRGECFSAWDDVWTQIPSSPQQALAIARYNLS